MRPLFTQRRRSRVTSASPRRIDNGVVQNASYELGETFAQTSARRVAATRTAALPASARRNLLSGVFSRCAHGVRPA
jgi:hypothetical protein